MAVILAANPALCLSSRSTRYPGIEGLFDSTSSLGECVGDSSRLAGGQEPDDF